MQVQFYSKNITVDQYTSPAPHVLEAEKSLSEAAKLMKAAGVRHLPIIDGDKIVGIISERDVKSTGIFDDRIPVKEFMKDEIFVANENDLLENVAYEMSSRKIGSAIVCDNTGKLVGIFTVTDALNALVEILRGEVLS